MLSQDLQQKNPDLASEAVLHEQRAQAAHAHATYGKFNHSASPKQEGIIADAMSHPDGWYLDFQVERALEHEPVLQGCLQDGLLDLLLLHGIGPAVVAHGSRAGHEPRPHLCQLSQQQHGHTSHAMAMLLLALLRTSITATWHRKCSGSACPYAVPASRARSLHVQKMNSL